MSWTEGAKGECSDEKVSSRASTLHVAIYPGPAFQLRTGVLFQSSANASLSLLSL